MPSSTPALRKSSRWLVTASSPLVPMNGEHTFQVQGMDCADCARTLEKGIQELDGVQLCQLSFATEKMRVVGQVTRDDVIARVRELGYDVVEPPEDGDNHAQDKQPPGFLLYMWQRRDTRLALVGALLVLPGFIFNEILGLHLPGFHVTSIAAFITAGVPIFRSAVRAVRISHQVNVNVLMTIAGIGAVIIGAYTEAATVIVLFAIGEALEGYTVGRARHAIRSLMQVVPNQATLLHRHPSHSRQEWEQPVEKRVKVEQLGVGDVILVRPGERIPMDGRVVAGASSVNQAPITGESRLVEKAVGSDVLASSINGEGSLEIEVTHVVADNTISRLIKMVEEAQETRAPTQRFVDRFARYYTPAVVGLAALAAVVPPLLFGQPFLNPDPGTFGWLYRGLALLVISCPCALVISTPVSIISAISNASRHGVLFKGGAFVESLGRVKAIAFDKTGTLTQGRPGVVAVRSVNHQPTPAVPSPRGDATGWTLGDEAERCHDCDDLLALAAAVERHSEHPIAHAVVAEATRYGLHDRYPPAKMVTALTGRGVTGQVQGRQVMIGSHHHFRASHIRHSEEHCVRASQDAEQGLTPMMVAVDGEYLGTITVADKLRPSSREAIAMLKQAGLQTIVLLSGDNTTTAQAVGEQVGVTDVRAELLPQDKVSAVKALQRAFGSVAMVGDGINDAPALATADVGIAIGGASGGTGQAMETADITLMSDDLRQIPFALGVSRAAMRTIITNVVLALGIKLVFLILVLSGMGTMWMAIAADMGTSLLVTLNGMRLLRRPA